MSSYLVCVVLCVLESLSTHMPVNLSPNPLRIEIDEADRTFGKSVHAEFKRHPGAEHIASQIALAYLSACLRSFRPRKVLELGAGIGTITYALLKHPCELEHVVATESDAHCIS